MPSTREAPPSTPAHFRNSFHVMDEVSFSDLQLKGKATVERWLRSSAGRPLQVRRRDAEDLVLTTASRAAQEREASSATSRLFVAMMRHGHGMREVVTAALPEAFPWVTFLSAEEVGEFVDELVATLRAAESIDNPAPVAQVIESWRHTAEVLADPELAAVLAAPSDGDYGKVPTPE